MPSYDFRCKVCGLQFTAKLSLAEKSRAVCEQCGSNELEQLFKRCNIVHSRSRSCERLGSCGRGSSFAGGDCSEGGCSFGGSCGNFPGA